MEQVQNHNLDKNALETYSRISVLENNVSLLSRNMEKIENQIDQNYATLHSRISDLRDDLRNDFETKHERIIQKIDEHSENSAVQSKSLNDKISQIERWRWMIMGAALVAGYLLAHIKLEKLM